MSNARILHNAGRQNPDHHRWRMQLSSRMKMMGCRESFVELPVDAAIACRHVPRGHQVRSYPGGKAMVLVMIQDWDRCILDGFLPIQRLKMAHIWIELDGPEEIGAKLPGTTSALPTTYYYALPHQMDNRFAWLAFQLVGIDVQYVPRIEIEKDSASFRRVTVVEQESPRIAYSWEEAGILWPSPKALTGRRWFYRQYGRRIKRHSEGLVVCRSSFYGESRIQIRAHAQSALGKLGFGQRLQGEMRFVTTDCECVVRVAAGERSPS